MFIQQKKITLIHTCLFFKLNIKIISFDCCFWYSPSTKSELDLQLISQSSKDDKRQGYQKSIFQFRVRFMVFNTTFNNISVILLRSVLFVEESRVHGENHWPAASHRQTLLHNVVFSTPCHEWDSNSQL